MEHHDEKKKNMKKHEKSRLRAFARTRGKKGKLRNVMEKNWLGGQNELAGRPE